MENSRTEELGGLQSMGKSDKKLDTPSMHTYFHSYDENGMHFSDAGKDQLLQSGSSTWEDTRIQYPLLI